MVSNLTTQIERRILFDKKMLYKHLLITKFVQRSTHAQTLILVVICMLLNIASLKGNLWR